MEHTNALCEIFLRRGRDMEFNHRIKGTLIYLREKYKGYSIIFGDEIDKNIIASLRQIFELKYMFSSSDEFSWKNAIEFCPCFTIIHEIKLLFVPFDFTNGDENIYKLNYPNRVYSLKVLLLCETTDGLMIPDEIVIKMTDDEFCILDKYPPYQMEISITKKPIY